MKSGQRSACTRRSKTSSTFFCARYSASKKRLSFLARYNCTTLEIMTDHATMEKTTAVNYKENQLSMHDYLSIRNEYMDDSRGQRTGFRTRYSEHLLGWGHWVGTTVLFRPELRFERSYDAAAYDNGTKKNQLTLSADMILFF